MLLRTQVDIKSVAWMKMKYYNWIMSLLIAVLVLTALSINVLSQQQVPDRFPIEITYTGRLIISINGEDYVNNTITNVVEYCDEIVYQISINALYKVRVQATYLPLFSTIMLENTTMELESLQVSPDCALELVASLLNNTAVFSQYDVPLVIDINNNTSTLKPVRRDGEIVGFLRLDIDLVHITRLTRSENASSYTYRSYDLHYEPITNVPFYYIEVYLETSLKGQISYFTYIYLEKERGLSENIIRKVYEVELFDPETEASKRTTLIVIYFADKTDDQREELLNITTIFENNILTVRFKEKTPCFIQLGVLKEEINATIPMSSYITINGRVHYTPRPIMCELINITINLGQLERLLEQKDFPEKGLPPQIPNETTGDFVVATVVVIPIILISYSAISKLLAILLQARIKERLE